MLLTTPSSGDASAGVAERRLGGATGAGWVPGRSGNPSGRPQKTEPERQAEALAKEKAPAAMRKLVSMIESPKTTEAGRLRAIELLLDRALGKPLQRPELASQELVINVLPWGVCTEPVPGVLNSPIKEQIWQKPAPALHVVTTIDTEEPSS